MLLTNHDLHDLHAIFLILRANPTDEHHELAITAVKNIIDSPQKGNVIESNMIRTALSSIEALDREKWYFIDTQNVYTWGTVLIKDECVYDILSACLEEVLIALRENNVGRISDLADALHNVPIILAEGGKKMRQNINREISYLYRPKWNHSFLKNII